MCVCVCKYLKQLIRVRLDSRQSISTSVPSVGILLLRTYDHGRSPSQSINPPISLSLSQLEE